MFILVCKEALLVLIMQSDFSAQLIFDALYNCPHVEYTQYIASENMVPLEEAVPAY